MTEFKVNSIIRILGFYTNENTGTNLGIGKVNIIVFLKVKMVRYDNTLYLKRLKHIVRDNCLHPDKESKES